VEPGRGHTTTAVFGRAREGVEFTDLVRPDVPAPADCPSFRDPPPPGMPVWAPMPFWTRVEGRPALGLPPWDDESPRSSSLQAIWQAFDEPPLGADGTLDPFAVVALADTMPGAVTQKTGPTERPWFGPSVDLTVHLFAPARGRWLLCANRARHAGGGYASVDMELWDEAGTLVAYATQAMFFTFLDPPA
jgi:acyl-CoA thioesterase